MSNVLDKFFGIHAQALNIWTQRAEQLGANIANADTPHYKAKDLDFQAALKQANSSQEVVLNATRENHIAYKSPGAVIAETRYRIPLQSSFDGNTVDSQLEHSLFAENSIRHQVSSRFLSNRISGLIKTLREE